MVHFSRVLFVLGVFAVSLAAQRPLSEAYPAARHGGPYMYNYYIAPAPGTTPWEPCWSPDGRWIAVAMQGSVWQVDPQTGEAVELTNTRGYASSPTWSPDGNWLVYTVDTDGRRIQLEAANLATGSSHALTNDQQVYLDPAFSPDGSRLAYVSTEPNGYFNVYIRAIQDGRWAGKPEAVSQDNSYPRERLYFGRWDMHTQPAWTPDGKELILVSNQDAALGSGDMWRVPARAGGMAAAVRISREQTLYRTRPHVSPDGRRIVYSSMAGGADQFHNLYLLPITGGDHYKLTFGSYDHFHPRWSPDGQWIAYISNEEVLPQLCLLEVWGGKTKKIAITRRKWRRPMGTLKVRVVDEASGRPTAARIHLETADGRFYAPPDTCARITATGRDYFHTAGEFTLELPPGPVTLQAVKGFEYEPLSREVQVEVARTAAVTLPLRRIADLAAQGWHSGSTHVHMNYGGNLNLTPESLARMAAAEDLHVVNAMASNKDNRVLDWQYFQPGGREYPLKQPVPGIHVMFGQEYRPAFHGHSFLLGMKNHLISPYTSNYEGTAIDSLYPTNVDIFRKARQQGAITGYVHPFGDTDPLESGLGAKAFPIDAALGTLDALEWSGAVKAQMAVWHKALNNDIALAPVGGEDSINDLHRLRTLGAVRTYVYLDGQLSAPAWIEGIRRGRTFFTTGPLLDLRVSGRLPGDQLSLPAKGGEVVVAVDVKSVAPLSRVTLYHAGGVLREIPLEGGKTRARLKESIRISESDWIALAAEGPFDSRFDAAYALAGTNAVRVYVGDRKIRDRASAEYFLRWIDKLEKMTLEWPWWNSQAEQDHVLGQYQEAREVYRRFIGEAKP